ncbi:MAG: hypothetical protein ACOX09_02080 [Candidatus Kapaibacterium sp.]
MKKCTYLIAIIMAIMLPNMLFSQTYPLQVIITQKQARFTPFIRQFMENPGQYLSVRVVQSGASAKSRNIYLKMNLQQLFPQNDVSIVSNLNTRPMQPIQINPIASTELTPSQIKDNFGNFTNPNDFEIRGLNVNDYASITGTMRIPEGQYKLCLTAYDFDAATGSSVALSDPNMGCTIVKICYEAENPQWILPISSLSSIEANYIKKRIKPQKIITLQWRPPFNTCGLNMTGITYDLNIVQLIDGQTEDDAILRNPPVVRRENLNTATFQIDTAMYPNMFIQGETYVLQVTAKSNDQSIEFKNNGKSPAGSFIYDTVSETKPMMASGGLNVDCGINPPDEKELIQELSINDIIDIGQYKLKILKITKNSDNSFTGEGIVTGGNESNFPNYNWVNVKVSFEKLQVNKNGAVVAGNAIGMYDDKEQEEYNNFFKSFTFFNKENWYNKYFNLKDGKQNSETQNYINKFTTEKLASRPEDANLLPIKIGGEGQLNNDIAVSSIVFSARGAKISMLHFLKDHENNIVIPFGIADVCVDKSINEADFAILQATELSVGPKTKLALPYEEGKKTHLKWNKGFKGINLNAEIRILTDPNANPPSDIVRKDGKNDPIAIPITNKEIQDWENWTVDLKIDTEFSINGFTDFYFTVPKAIYTHSNQPSAELQNLCKKIKEKDPHFKVDAKFKGLLFQQLTLYAPEKFNFKKNDDTPASVTFSTASFLNQNGFTMIASAVDVFGDTKDNSIGEGKTGVLGGWGFAIDTISLFIIHNEFKEVFMNGRLWCPLGDITGKEGSMKYKCNLTRDATKKNIDYNFNIIADNAKLKFLKYFSVGLRPSSIIKANNDKHGFAVIAWLDGEVSADIEEMKIKFTGGSFKGLGIANRNAKGNPGLVLSIGQWGFGDVGTSEDFSETDSDAPEKKDKVVPEGNFGPFELKIMAPTLSIANGKDIAFNIGMSINLGLGETSVGASTKGKIIGVMNWGKKDSELIEITGIGFELNEIVVNGEVGPVKIKGGLAFYKNNTKYGDGFRGAVSCNFPIGAQGIEIASVVQFGKVGDQQNYFFVDASLKLNPGIAVFPPYLNFNGFGGGVWKNMKVTNPNVGNDIKDATEPNDIENIGASRSGLQFEPSEVGEKKFGFNARVYFSAASANLYNGVASITATTDGGKFESLSFKGNVNVIGDGNHDNPGGHIASGEVKIGYDHIKSEFNLEAEVDAKFNGVSVQVPFKVNILGKNETRPKPLWYIALGIPDYEKGKLFTVNTGFDLELVKGSIDIKAYICGGNNIPWDIPKLDKKILDIIEKEPIRNWPKGDKGIMLGARLGLGFGLEFGPLYGSLDAIIGCDLALKELEGMHCGDGRAIKGLNGYYGMGQVYGYVHGDVGVQIKIFGIKEKFSLCDLAAGAVISAGMPSPTWMRGVFGVKGEIFGGAISFNTSAKFSIGRPCIIYTDPLKDLKIVESITPGEEKLNDAEKQQKEERPSVFTAVKIATNVRMNTPWTLYAESSDGKKIPRKYNFTFLEADIFKDGVEHVNLQKSIVKAEGFEFRLKPKEMLEPNTMYKVKVVVKMQQHVDNVWQNPLDEKGRQYSDNDCKRIDYVYFYTGEMPNEIDISNIAQAFPMNRQYEAFIDEEDVGYIVLDKSQQYLIENRETSAEGHGLVGEFVNLSNTAEKPILFYYTYEPKLSRIENNWKSGIQFQLKNLAPNQIYKINFYVIERGKQQKDATFAQKDTNIAIVGTANTSGGANYHLDGSSDAFVGVNINTVKNEVLDRLKGEKTGIKNPIRAWKSDKMDSRINWGDDITSNFNSIGNKMNNSVSLLNNVTQISNVAQLSSVMSGTIGTMPQVGNVQPTMGYAPASTSGSGMAEYVGLTEEMANYLFGVSSITHIRDKVDTNKKTTLTNNCIETSELVKEQSELQSKYKNVTLKHIFAYVFHTSRYESTEAKMKEIEVRNSLKQGALSSVSTMENGVNTVSVYSDGISNNFLINLYGDGNHKWERRGARSVLMPVQIIYMPGYATQEEVFGGYAFEESSNAAYQSPMFRFSNEFASDYYRNLWNKLAVPFLNKLKENANADLSKLPFRRYEKQETINNPLSFEGYNAAVRFMNIYNGENTSKKEDYHGRLTNDEINTGSTNRARKQNNKMVYIYKNKLYSIYQILYASALASHIYDKGNKGNYLCKEISGSVIVDDNYYLDGQTAGYHLEVKYPELRKRMTVFFINEYQYFKDKISGLNCFNVERYCTDSWASSCLKKLYGYVKNNNTRSNIPDNMKSNLFYLAWYWNENWQDGNKKFYEFRDLKLPSHLLTIQYHRLGVWEYIKEVQLPKY